MNMRQFVLLSMASFVLPLGLAFYLSLWWMVAVLLGVLVFSSACHFSQEKILKSTDSLLAWILILSNAGLCYLGGFSLPYFAGVILLVCVALYFYFYTQRFNYQLGHGLWHIFSSLITVFSLLTFIK